MITFSTDGNMSSKAALRCISHISHSQIFLIALLYLCFSINQNKINLYSIKSFVNNRAFLPWRNLQKAVSLSHIQGIGINLIYSSANWVFYPIATKPPLCRLQNLSFCLSSFEGSRLLALISNFGCILLFYQFSLLQYMNFLLQRVVNLFYQTRIVCNCGLCKESHRYIMGSRNHPNSCTVYSSLNSISFFYISDCIFNLCTLVASSL